jgi:MoaA/NifB/PqqE/SkfB family radical SAM enzyme
MESVRRIPLTGSFRYAGGYCWSAAALSAGDNSNNPFKSSLLLYEDGAPLPLAHQSHANIRSTGLGRYSHWESSLFFSTSDNSDPNANGRKYEVELGYRLEQWQKAVVKHLCSLWKIHPQANYFLSRDGRDVPPPFFANLSLTNKCNLRCEICGSQRFIDETGTPRRHMAREKFLAVAETIFPFLVEVELNSQGDPLLHPDIELVLEAMARHRCDVKIQTNGTLFSERMLERLMACRGTVNLSLDAVGPRFDEVRRGGNWTKAEPGLLALLKHRDPRGLTVGLYPTVTRRTLNDFLPILDWSAEYGVDAVSFHRYSPIQNSTEEEPTPAERRSVREAIQRWIASHPATMEVSFDGERLSEHKETPLVRRTEAASPEKRAVVETFPTGRYLFAPTEFESKISDPLMTCTAPWHYVEVGLEGQIGACCRAQDIPLGYATSVEAFADAWFSVNYRKIRDSLNRDAKGPYPLPNCEGCISFFAPGAGKDRCAVDYTHANLCHAEVLNLDFGEEFLLEGVQLEEGYCRVARLPPDVDVKRYRLWEDERMLGPRESLHNEIRNLGSGRYSIWGRKIYFSSSDNTDPRRNGRRYALRVAKRAAE